MVDTDALYDHIAQARLTDWDKEVVAVAFDKAYRTFVAADQGRVVKLVEAGGENPVPYRIDLVLEDSNGLIVRDWKTKRSGKLDDVWELRESRSKQRKIYAAALAALLGPDIFPVRYEVCGVTLDPDSPQTKRLSFVIGEWEAHEAIRYLWDVHRMRDSLVEAGKTPWVQDPAGCRCFGPLYKCEFEGYCWEGLRPPEGLVTKPFSHSSAKEFLRCPERYRLLKVTDREESEEDTGQAGKVFHEVMEALYKQILTLGHSVVPVI